VKRFKTMTAILGISAFYHDSAAALMVDGEVRAAVQEERLSRKKHDASFPERAIQSCLSSSGLSGQDIDFVAFYEKPMLKFERLLETSLQYAPRGYGAFCRAMPSWARDKLRVRKKVREALGGEYQRRVLFVEHHESHAASAFYPSPFQEAAVLTLDGVGEWTTATVGIGHGNQIELLQEMRFPHSLGLLYSAFTTYCGFRINDGEYKLMGLAPYGKPRFANLIREQVVEIRDDGSFRLNMELFRFGYSMGATHSKFHRLFGGASRKEAAPIEQRHADLAASIQVVTEEILVKMARHVRGVTGARKLCLAGGVALNCVANGKLREQAIFEDVWVQPAAGDAGGALGAAMLVWHQLLNQPRTIGAPSFSRHTRLGPAFGAGAVAEELSALELPYERFSKSATLMDRVADALSAGKVVGWFQGEMEFGPRALGGRSLLADPRDPEMQSRLNVAVKGRESFRPFAPIVAQSSVSRYFDVPDSFSSPFMSTTVFVRGGEKGATTPTEASDSLDFATRLAQIRSEIPAVTHVDQSARVQTVRPEDDAKLNQLLKAFEARTGVPVLINTSFNGNDEPIVCTTRDALRCFLTTEIDLLVMEDCLIDRSKISEGSAVLERLAVEEQAEERATGLEPKSRWSFAGAIAVMMFFLASRWYAASGAVSWSLFGLVLIGCTVLGLPWAWPHGVDRLHRLASVISRPVGWCLSRITLSFIYVGVLIPVAGVMRLGGHDPLGLGRSEGKETYWQVREVRPEVQRYFRQFR
jgi:carbamoyltransferase